MVFVNTKAFIPPIFLLAAVTLDQSQYYPTINVSLAGGVKYYLPRVPTATITGVAFVISVIIKSTKVLMPRW